MSIFASKNVPFSWQMPLKYEEYPQTLHGNAEKFYQNFAGDTFYHQLKSILESTFFKYLVEYVCVSVG